MRLIDADALFEKVPYGDIEHDVKISKCGAIADICTWILTAPTIDAVPVEKYHELLENFIDYACSGVPNLSPYCVNRCVECGDKRGWCKQNECRGVNPDVRKEKR